MHELLLLLMWCFFYNFVSGLELGALLQLLDGHRRGHAILDLELPLAPTVPFLSRHGIDNELDDDLPHCNRASGVDKL